MSTPWSPEPFPEQAYRIAMQVVELRERHGLPQSQPAERCGADQADINRIGLVSDTLARAKADC